ncbi:MFS transporter [Nonomuraea sp. NPDC049684]|uniref:MFS transporter n=1 Tax=Nonomuraea sp. NPDC049684 TaxID=3364356 RepID=UPI0037A6B15F
MTSGQRLVLVLLLGSQFMLAVDFSILNVALPVIGSGLGFALSDLQWVATAFALAAAGFTLLFGRIADLFGRRRLFLAGMVLLGVSSPAGGLAVSPGMLLAARVAQGLATGRRHARRARAADHVVPRRAAAGAERPRMDLPGAVSVTAGLLALVFGLTRAGEHGFADPLGLRALAAAPPCSSPSGTSSAAPPRPSCPSRSRPGRT